MKTDAGINSVSLQDAAELLFIPWISGVEFFFVYIGDMPSNINVHCLAF